MLEQSQTYAQGSTQVVYHSELRPLLQGKYIPVGYYSSASLGQLTAVAISLTATQAPASVRLVGETVSGEKIELGAVSNPESQVSFKLKNLNVVFIKIWVEVKAQKDHDLLDIINMVPSEVKINDRNVSLTLSKETPNYRIAKELRNTGFDGIHSYRIPGLVTTPKGTLIAVYDIRKNSSVDLQDDVDVGMSRSTDGGDTWDPMEVIMDMGTYGGLPQDQNGVGDPTVLVDPSTGYIYVVALWAHGKPGERIWFSSRQGMTPQETGQLVLTKSEDDGGTWSAPVNITTQLKDPSWNLFFNGPGMGITLKDGTLVFPAQFKDADQMPHSTIVYSKDKGDTWKVGTGAKSNTTEAQVVELTNGSLMLNMRDNRGGFRSIAITENMGETWVEHSSSRSALVEPVCMASIIRHPTDDLLLFSNPAVSDGRYNMTIKSSTDQGLSWPVGQQLLLDEGPGWGYSCLTLIDQEHVGILYESSVAHMTFQKIKLTDIIN
jgi:sialidase-1